MSLKRSAYPSHSKDKLPSQSKQSEKSQQKKTIRSQMLPTILRYEYLTEKEHKDGSLCEQESEELFGVINSIGMRYGKEGYFSKAINLLERSEKYASHQIKLLIILNNNLACIYKKMCRYELAIDLIKKSWSLILQLMAKESVPNEDLQDSSQSNSIVTILPNQKYQKMIAECSINLCAIYSAMKQHQQALLAIQKGVAILDHYLQKSSENRPALKFYSEIFLIAKYNEAVELEYLQRFQEANQAYCKANTWMQKINKSGFTNCEYMRDRIVQAIEVIQTKMKVKSRQQKATLLLQNYQSFKENTVKESKYLIKRQPRIRMQMPLSENLQFQFSKQKKNQKKEIQTINRNHSQKVDENYRSLEDLCKAASIKKLSSSIKKPKIKINFINPSLMQTNFFTEANNKNTIKFNMIKNVQDKKENYNPSIMIHSRGLSEDYFKELMERRTKSNLSTLDPTNYNSNRLIENVQQVPKKSHQRSIFSEISNHQANI